MPPTPTVERAPARTLLAGLCLAPGLAACTAAEPPPPPPREIPVVEVIQRDQPIEIEMVGETRGSADIPIRARVEGVVIGMHFTEGRRVQAGDLLYEIDPAPFESKVVEADGGLAEARTKLAKAKSDLDRIRPLAEMNAVSQIDLTGAKAQYQAALGALRAAEARKRQAEIELGYTNIAAPISGRIGISEAQVGEFVGRDPNPVVLNYVSRTNPIRVRFAIDERRYLRLARRIRDLERDDSAEAEEDPGLQLILADGTVHPHRGKSVAVDAAVDPETGTFTIEADFPNPDEIVLAGQFARVRAILEVRRDSLLVPARAISELQGIHRVYVVRADDTLELRQVELGPKIDRLRIVESGLAPGERISLEVMRLSDGSKVVPQPTQFGNVAAPPPES
ncbi:MAG: efflux RND transporter periplasmic adaptor subunit [Proteobacteria bacterium]|nr:efflux RND transporter periplasmic adaptor subunit [Pseudomonadota bacterium]